jgi:hypothetical protein
MVTNSELSYLNNNIMTLATIDEPDQEDILLAPSFLRGTAFGRGWLWAIGDATQIKEKLKEEIRTNHELFKKLLAEIKELNSKLEVCYCTPNNGKDVATSRRVIQLAEFLGCFFDTQVPFSLERSLKSMHRVFQKNLKDKIFSKEDVVQLEHFEKEYATLAVEGILQADFPIDILKRLLIKDVLSAKQKKQLDEWLQLVEEKRERLTPSLFHKALQGIGMYICKERELPLEEYNNIYVLLEIALLDCGCKILSQDDSAYSQWLYSLTPGTVIDSEQPVQLGTALQHTSLTKLGLFAFKREGFDNQMVLFGKSIAFLGMWKIHCIDAMPPEWRLKVEYRDSEGRFLVVEKLNSSLDQVTWKTKHAAIEKDDISKLDSLSSLIAIMATQQRTPADSLPEYMFFNNKDELRCLIPIAKSGLFDFNALTKFVLKCSVNGKNFPVCRYLYSKSKLKNEPVIKFYLDIVEQHFVLKPRASIAEIAASHKYKIGDPRVPDYIKDIHIPKLKDLQHTLKLSLVPKLKDKTDGGRKKLQDEISLAIVEFQRDAGFLASEWPDAETRIKTYLLDKKRSQLFQASSASFPVGALEA